MQISQQLNKPKPLLRASHSQRITAAVIFIVVAGFFSVFAIAGHYEIDMGFWLGRCGFKQNTGLPCPTCGMTTATKAFAQGKILQAFYIQPAGAFLCTIIVIAGILAFITAVFGVHFRFITRFFTEVKVRYIILAVVIIILSGWAVTLSRAVAAKYF
jgi:multisubunit Na+/H+ antiporter MnhB subunit